MNTIADLRALLDRYESGDHNAHEDMLSWFPWLLGRLERYEAALNEIATDPHCTPGMHSPSRAGDDQYRTGIADGHRCAANKARTALTAASRAGGGEG